MLVALLVLVFSPSARPCSVAHLDSRRVHNYHLAHRDRLETQSILREIVACMAIDQDPVLGNVRVRRIPLIAESVKVLADEQWYAYHVRGSLREVILAEKLKAYLIKRFMAPPYISFSQELNIMQNPAWSEAIDYDNTISLRIGPKRIVEYWATHKI